jgi:hypothetical protein
MQSSTARRSRSTSEAGMAWASVVDAHGRQYFTDQFNHRVVVGDITGRAWSFGQSGWGAGDLRFPRGLAVVSAATAEATQVFVADTRNNRIQVFDGVGRLRFAFGGCGDKAGQFRAPADLVIASPELPWEGDRGAREAMPVLVVSDQWNGRLQVFTLEGAWLATIGGRAIVRNETAETLPECPFFRLDALGVPRDPVRLSWHGPWLTVVGGNGRAHRIDLASALLPTFEQWQQAAPEAERAHARRYFSLSRHGRPDVPAAVLQALSLESPVA